MCDYCGCRRHAPIEELSGEHEELLEVGYRLRRLTREGRPDEALALLEQRLVPLLRSHTSKEERGLFVQLRSAWEADDRLDSLVDEHRTIAMAAGDLRSAVAPGVYGTSPQGILMAEDTRSAWEAYIPERMDLRPRAEAILADVATRFGKRVVPMAEGGMRERS